MSCAGNRINSPTCECPPGFEDTGAAECSFKGRHKCILPTNHILHIKDAEQFGGVTKLTTAEHGYCFDGVDGYMKF